MAPGPYHYRFSAALGEKTVSKRDAMKISICLALLLPFSPTPSPSGTLSPPAPRLGPPGSGPDLAGPPRPAASLPDTSGHGTPLPTLLPPAGALPGWRWTQGLQRPAPLTHTHTWWSVEGRLKDHRSLPSSTQARTHGSRVRYAFFLFFFFGLVNHDCASNRYALLLGSHIWLSQSTK